ncbi:hypothetical protein [Rhizobium terrae]|uniref:hypothetical protein n=1 Tax=Rhizobium terrae TaxID=2171756 RepID=UPI000E3CB717|nr:hypothetical protein [Rhizobium terrae]
MVALSVIVAVVTVLAGVFAVVTRQMAVAHRQQYLEEIALNNLACATVELDRKACRHEPVRTPAPIAPRKRIRHTLTRHSHAPLLAR